MKTTIIARSASTVAAPCAAFATSWAVTVTATPARANAAAAAALVARGAATEGSPAWSPPV